MSTGIMIFAMYDKKVSIYRHPHFHQNIPDAVRDLEQLIRHEKSQISLYPEDFDLYKLGSLDEKSGKIEITNPPLFIVSAINLKHRNESENVGK